VSFEYCRIEPSGMRVGYESRGSGPLVIFLHGFPDTYRGFLSTMDKVAAAGYRAVAPEPRGYAPSDLAPDGDYRVEAFAKDVVGLADALGAERFSLVGHDLGALTAYATANLAPTRVERIVTAAVPHTGHFLLHIRLKQAIRSRYMVYFQLPWLPERLIRRNDFAYIESLVRLWAPNWNFDEATMRPLKTNYSESKRLSAALAVYRQLPASLASPLSRRLVFGPVQAPTRLLYGTGDRCIGPELFSGQAQRFAQPLDLVAMEGSGHFIQWEQPERFAEEVLSFLKYQ
jgi:pimeloyl-ACP methyl ester carboxylesterase